MSTSSTIYLIPPHLAHPARTNSEKTLVGTEARTGREGHVSPPSGAIVPLTAREINLLRGTGRVLLRAESNER